MENRDNQLNLNTLSVKLTALGRTRKVFFRLGAALSVNNIGVSK